MKTLVEVRAKQRRGEVVRFALENSGCDMVELTFASSVAAIDPVECMH